MNKYINNNSCKKTRSLTIDDNVRLMKSFCENLFKKIENNQPLMWQ